MSGRRTGRGPGWEKRFERQFLAADEYLDVTFHDRGKGIIKHARVFFVIFNSTFHITNIFYALHCTYVYCNLSRILVNSENITNL